jgi:predicted nucleotidyltransferase
MNAIVVNDGSPWRATKKILDDCSERSAMQKALAASINPALLRSLFNAYESRELTGHFVAFIASECDIDQLRLLADTVSEIRDLATLKRLIWPVRKDVPPKDEDFGRHTASAKPSASCTEAESLDNLIDHHDQKRSAILWLDRSAEGLKSLFAELGSRIPEYIERLPELIGLNSLVRRGRIKVLTASDGTIFISKRSEAGKLAKFKNDCIMALAIGERLGLREGGSLDLSDSSCGPITVSILPHVAVVAGPRGEGMYVVSEYLPFGTLEEVLHRTTDPERRRQILLQCRLILKRLLRAGIVWVDMAPRNILLRIGVERTEYVLLDFEKSYLTDAPAADDIVMVHGRGPIFSEEFSAVCTLEEVTDIFADHYSPKSWTLSDAGPVELSRPKREIVDLLAGRGLTPTMAAYNAVELEVVGARFMYQGADGKVRRPVYCGFRVDHYLGAEYDRKLTEVFIGARKYELLDQTVDVVDFCIRQYEFALLLSDLAEHLTGRNRVGPQQETTLSQLRTALDALFACESREAFKKVLETLGLRMSIVSLRDAAVRGELSPDILRERIGALYRPIVETGAAIAELDTGAARAAVVLLGGFARGDIAPNSDLDLIVIGSSADVDFGSIRRSLRNRFQDGYGVPVEFSPDQTLESLAVYLDRDSDALLDRACMVAIAGDVALAKDVTAILENVAHDAPSWPERAMRIGLDLPPTPKMLLRLLHLAVRSGFAEFEPVLADAQQLLYLAKFEEGAKAAGFFTIPSLPASCLATLRAAVHAALESLWAGKTRAAKRRPLKASHAG